MANSLSSPVSKIIPHFFNFIVDESKRRPLCDKDTNIMQDTNCDDKKRRKRTISGVTEGNVNEFYKMRPTQITAQTGFKHESVSAGHRTEPVASLESRSSSEISNGAKLWQLAIPGYFSESPKTGSSVSSPLSSLSETLAQTTLETDLTLLESQPTVDHQRYNSSTSEPGSDGMFSSLRLKLGNSFQATVYLDKKVLGIISSSAPEERDASPCRTTTVAESLQQSASKGAVRLQRSLSESYLQCHEPVHTGHKSASRSRCLQFFSPESPSSFAPPSSVSLSSEFAAVSPDLISFDAPCEPPQSASRACISPLPPMSVSDEVSSRRKSFGPKSVSTPEITRRISRKFSNNQNSIITRSLDFPCSSQPLPGSGDEGESDNGFDRQPSNVASSNFCVTNEFATFGTFMSPCPASSRPSASGDSLEDNDCSSGSGRLSLAREKMYVLPVVEKKDDGAARISIDTMADLLSGKYSDVLEHFLIVDCRYDFEFENGHINGAVNINDKNLIKQLYLVNKQYASQPKKIAIIFHCEFSRVRGPKACRYFRATDRLENEFQYPTLSFPEIYVMEGGYKAFFSKYSKSCTPEQYVTMWDDRFANQMRRADYVFHQSWAEPTKKKKRDQFHQLRPSFHGRRISTGPAGPAILAASEPASNSKENLHD